MDNSSMSDVDLVDQIEHNLKILATRWREELGKPACMNPWQVSDGLSNVEKLRGLISILYERRFRKLGGGA